MKTEQASPRRRLILTLLGLVAAFGAPALAAWIVYTYSEQLAPEDSVANGTLIQPVRTLPEVALTRVDGSTLSLDDLKGRWTLLHAAPSACAAPCRDTLHNITQVRLATNEDMRRIQSLWVLTDPADPAAVKPVREAHPRLLVASAAGEAAAKFLERLRLPGDRPGALAGRVYIVDPLGNLVLYYGPGDDPKGILRDLRRLLKASRIG